MRADFERQIEERTAMMEEERKKAELLADEVSSLIMKIGTLGNVTRENKKENVTTCPSVTFLPDELANETIEQLKMEKRKIIAFIIQA